ncbi:MAG: TIGR02530 family flagellar biosynthesis protein [Thermoleophilaceae bacterium]
MTGPLHNPALLPPGAVAPAGAPAAPAGAARAQRPEGPSFAEVLSRQTEGVQFSKHALQRVERRGIELDGTTVARLEDGVDRAAGKGARDAVVFVDGTAFVVAVKNRTVVTAVNAEHMREHVFTNIDSAVIA